MIDIFKELTDYNKYFESQLALSSTILGLIIATSTFILQSGFTSFQFSRSMFIKYYVHQSKFVFLSLAYNILFSLIVLYLSVNSSTLFCLHLILALIFSKYFLDFYSHKGYILTLHSSKYNPYKKGILRYFRYIHNLGLLQNIIIYATLYIIFFYPLHFNNAFSLNNHQVFMTTVSCLAFTTIVVIRIIPQFFTFSEQEYKSKTTNEVTDNIEVDLSKENEILRDTLIKNGRVELQKQIETEYFDSLFVNMTNNKKEAFFVINIEASDKNVYEIVDAIDIYSYEFLIDLSNIHTDTNNFVLSYFIKVENDNKTRSYFIRTSRNEIDQLKRKNFKPKDFIYHLSNKLIDELFRNL